MTQPSQNVAASGRGALPPAGSPKPGPSSPRLSQEGWGSSAASQAFRSHMPPRQPLLSPDDNQQGRPLAAARDAMSGMRPRSVSSPPNSVSAAAAASALAAAMLAHRPSATTASSSSKTEAGASPAVAVARKIYASGPLEEEHGQEQRDADLRHASAVAMAKTIYLQQQRMVDSAIREEQEKKGVQTNEAMSDNGEDVASGRAVTLQEAAYRLAQERLKRLQEELERNRDLQSYHASPASFPHRRFQLPTRLRKRSSSVGDGEAPRFTIQRGGAVAPAAGVLPADEQQDRQGRDAVLEMARQNVKMQLRDMDETLSAQRAKNGSALQGEWELKAHASAQARYELSRSENSGKLDVGGGMFVSKSDIDAIALKRVQPLLDGIDERVRSERQRQELIKVEQEAKKQAHSRLKAQDRELKQVARKARDQEKAEDRSRRHQTETQDGRPSGNEDRLAGRLDRLGRKPRLDTSAEKPQEEGGASPTSKVKTWLKSRLAVRKETEEDETEARGFIGGKALRDSVASSDKPAPALGDQAGSSQSPSLVRKDVASTAHHHHHHRQQQAQQQQPDPGSVSPLLSSATEGLGGDRPATPPPGRVDAPPAVFTPAQASSPGRDSRFRELFTDVG